ncbi:MAG: flagellar hook capping FlgD N-terminal domain-containing protein [Opitutaceae bacterium]
MPIAPITSASSALLGTTDSSTAARVPQRTLGQEDFLKLLAVQFQSQDPMKPMEDTAFIAQMAQFSSLQQSQTLAQQMTQMRGNQDLVTASNYIGRQVTVDAGNDGIVKGNVTGVEITDGVPRLTIGEFTYPLSSVLYVGPGVSAPTTSPATSAAS